MTSPKRRGGCLGFRAKRSVSNPLYCIRYFYSIALQLFLQLFLLYLKLREKSWAMLALAEDGGRIWCGGYSAEFVSWPGVGYGYPESLWYRPRGQGSSAGPVV